VRRIAQAFFDPKQIVLTILGNLEKFKIGREDLGCCDLTDIQFVQLYLSLAPD